MEFGLDNLRSLGGVALIFFCSWLWSSARTQIAVRPVLAAFALQVTIGVLLFTFPGVRATLSAFTDVVAALQTATAEGTQFAFGYLAGGPAPFAATDPDNGFILAFQVLPVILTISTLAALFWHWGILERLCRGLGFVFGRLFNISGAAGLGASASIFLGMIEAPMVVRPYLARMSRADILLIMSAAMATIAGTMMAVYTALLLPRVDGVGAHIIAASFMSAPGAIALARILEPDTAAPTTAAEKPLPKFYQSTMDAFLRGVQDGLNVFMTVIAMIIVSVALIALVDMGLAAYAPAIGGETLSLGRIFGWVFAPVMYMLGLPWSESGVAGQLLGTKLMLNEFLAFLELAALPADAFTPRSRIIMIYVLCGFANFAALAIMLGGLSAMCPDRRPDFLALGMKSIYAGFATNMMSGAIVGVLL